MSGVRIIDPIPENPTQKDISDLVEELKVIFQEAFDEDNTVIIEVCSVLHESIHLVSSEVRLSHSQTSAPLLHYFGVSE